MQQTTNTFETFIFAGQKRYRCNYKWEDGGQCPFDTYAMDIMNEHLELHRKHDAKERKIKRGTEMPSKLFGPDGNPLTKHD